MRQHRLDIDVAVEPVVDEQRHLGAALDAAKRRAGYATAGDQEARHDLEHLALAGHTTHRGETPRLARAFDGLAHDVDVASRLEGVVGAVATRLLFDPIDGVGAGEPRLGRAVVTCVRESSLSKIDRDDALGTRQPRADDGTETDQAAAEDDSRRAALDLGGIQRRADAGRKAAGKRSTAIERCLWTHFGERDLGHHGVLGERRGAHEVPHRLAITRQARGAVGQIAKPLLLANRDAAVRTTTLALDALAALGREQGDHVIAGLDERDALTDLLDDARTFVPEHARCVARRVGARCRVQVCVADTTGLDPHEHLACLRLCEVHLLNDEWLAELFQDCGTNLHDEKRRRRVSVLATLLTHVREIRLSDDPDLCVVSFAEDRAMRLTQTINDHDRWWVRVGVFALGRRLRSEHAKEAKLLATWPGTANLEPASHSSTHGFPIATTRKARWPRQSDTLGNICHEALHPWRAAP